MPSETLSVIEVGTSRTVILVGRPEKDGRITVLVASANDMTGLRKGQVVIPSNVRAGVRHALDVARSKQELPELNNWLIFSGGNVSSHTVVHSVLTNGMVTSDNISEAVGGATRAQPSAKRTILHCVQQEFVVRQGESERMVQDAEKLRGDSLQANVMLIHCDEVALGDMHTVVEDSHLPLRGHIFSAVCAARAVLSDEQRADGVLLLNLGGGTTSYALYSGGILRAAGSIPVGGDHVTNDLSQAFHLSFRKAEEIKRKHGSADLTDTPREATIPVPASGITDRDRILSLQAFNSVINARIDELFRVVLAQVGGTGYVSVVLVGGGALLKGILRIAESVFHCECAVGAIRDGMHFDEDGALDPLFATAYGALYVAYDELVEAEKRRPRSLFGRFFGNGGAK